MTLYAFSALLNLITSFTLGSFVLYCKKSDPINRAWFYFTFSVGFFSLSQFMRESAPDEKVAFFWGGHILFTSVVAIYITFPLFIHRITRRQASEWSRIAYLCLMALFLYLINATSLVIQPEMHAKGPFRFYNIPGPLYPFVTGMYLVVVGYGIAVLCRQHKQITSQSEKRQIVYMVLAFIVGFGGGSTNFWVDFNINVFPFGNYFIPAYTAIVSYAIVKHRLMDITIIIRRTLVYSTVLSSLAIVYFGALMASARLFQGLAGSQTYLSSAIAAGLVTLLFQPLRKRVQTYVDRKFFRQYVDREEKLYELSRDVVTHTSPEVMATVLQNVLRETFHPKAGALYLRARESPGFTLISHWSGLEMTALGDEHPLVKYLASHPQPFVLDEAFEAGASQSTRSMRVQRRTY